MQKIIDILKSTIILFLKWPLARRALRMAVRIFAPRHRIGIASIVIDEQKGVLLLNHVFHPTIPWGVPGGWLDRGESPIEGAMRELWEETGLKASEGKLINMRRDNYPDHLAIAYLMKVDSEIDLSKLNLSNEIVSAAWFKVTNLPHLTPFNYESVLIADEILKKNIASSNQS